MCKKLPSIESQILWQLKWLQFYAFFLCSIQVTTWTRYLRLAFYRIQISICMSKRTPDPVSEKILEILLSDRDKEQK